MHRRLAQQLALLARLCDRVLLLAARADAPNALPLVANDTLRVQQKVLESGRWHATAGFVHAIGAAALIQVRHAQAGSVGEADAALTMATWLWHGANGAARLGADHAFLGLRGMLSYGANLKAAASPLAATMTTVAQLGMSLTTGKLTLSNWLEQATAHLSNACTDVLVSVEDTLRRKLASPYKIVLPLVDGTESETMLGKAPGVIVEALSLLQQAPPALDEMKASLNKLTRFLDKVRPPVIA